MNKDKNFYYNREGYVDGCFVVFESLVKSCRTEEEFVSRKEEFYQIFKKSAHETKLDKEEVDYIWSRLKVMIEDKRKELFKPKKTKSETNFSWKEWDDFFERNSKQNYSKYWEEILKDQSYKSSGYNWYNFGDPFGFNSNFNHNRRSYHNFNGFQFNNTSTNIEVSFKYFELTKTATEEQLTKAYRIKSLKTHPDKPRGSKELFQECQKYKEICLSFIKRGY